MFDVACFNFMLQAAAGGDVQSCRKLFHAHTVQGDAIHLQACMLLF
jgi:hypothetical protein